jgi:predicted RNA-binding protein with PUA-like domain
MKHWLMKTEPETFSINDLMSRENQTEHWDGVRNYQARNFMRDEMNKGDRVLFYHSNCGEPGVYGTAEVACAAYPDFTAFDPASKYYDPKSAPDKPVWMMVDVKFCEKFTSPVSLRQIKGTPELSGMKLVQKGMRLSVQPVEKDEYDLIVKLGRGE